MNRYGENIDPENMRSYNPYDRSMAYHSASLTDQESRQAMLYSGLRQDNRVRNWFPNVANTKSEMYLSAMANSPTMSRHIGGSYLDMSAGMGEAVRMSPGMSGNAQASRMVGGQLASAAQERMFAGGAFRTDAGMNRSEFGQTAAIFGSMGGMGKFVNEGMHTLNADNSEAGLARLQNQISSSAKGSDERKVAQQLHSRLQKAADAGEEASASVSYLDSGAKDSALKALGKFSKVMAVTKDVLQSDDLAAAAQTLTTLAGTNVAMDPEAANRAMQKLGRIKELGAQGYDTRKILSREMDSQNYTTQATGSVNMGVESFQRGMGQRAAALSESAAHAAQAMGLSGVHVPSADEVAKMQALGLADQFSGGQAASMSTTAYWANSYANDEGKKEFAQFKKQHAAASSVAEADNLLAAFNEKTASGALSDNGKSVADARNVVGSGAVALNGLNAAATKDAMDMAEKRAGLQRRENDRYAVEAMLTKEHDNPQESAKLKKDMGTLRDELEIGTMAELFKADGDAEKQRAVLKGAGFDKKAQNRLIKTTNDVAQVTTERTRSAFVENTISDARHYADNTTESKQALAAQAMAAWKGQATSDLQRERPRNGAEGALQAFLTPSNGERLSDTEVAAIYLRKQQRTNKKIGFSQVEKQHGDIIYDKKSGTYEVEEGSNLLKQGYKVGQKLDAEEYRELREKNKIRMVEKQHGDIIYDKKSGTYEIEEGSGLISQGYKAGQKLDKEEYAQLKKKLKKNNAKLVNGKVPQALENKRYGDFTYSNKTDKYTIQSKEMAKLYGLKVGDAVGNVKMDEIRTAEEKAGRSLAAGNLLDNGDVVMNSVDGVEVAEQRKGLAAQAVLAITNQSEAHKGMLYGADSKKDMKRVLGKWTSKKDQEKLIGQVHNMRVVGGNTDELTTMRRNSLALAEEEEAKAAKQRWWNPGFKSTHLKKAKKARDVYEAAGGQEERPAEGGAPSGEDGSTSGEGLTGEGGAVQLLAEIKEALDTILAKQDGV